MNRTPPEPALPAHCATFVLSTGRCGTQWLAEILGRGYGDRLRVEHEPLHNAWQPRLLLGAGSPERLPPDLAAPLLAHLDGVERDLAQRPYLECGHPCWSAIPYLALRFAGRLRVVHLVRHPVPTALSWLTHGAYQRPLAPHLREKVLLAPTDAGAAFPEYAARWNDLSPFEKCLYWWAEVNQFGLAQQQRLHPSTTLRIGLPWLRLDYTDLFGGDGLNRLLRFLELPEQAQAQQARAERVDRHRFFTLEQPAAAQTAGHPRIAGVAAALGYRLDAPSAWDGAGRYFGTAAV